MGAWTPPEPTDIVSIDSSWPDVSFPKTVPFEAVSLQLPEMCFVTLYDASTAKLYITWVEGSYDETTADTYTISGTLILTTQTNPSGLTASINVTVVAAIDPDDLPNQVIWAKDGYSDTGGQVDQWDNEWNASQDIIKITDARRPDLNATGINSLPYYDFVPGNNDLLKSESGLGLTGDFTYYVFWQSDAPTASARMILENAITMLPL